MENTNILVKLKEIHIDPMKALEIDPSLNYKTDQVKIYNTIFSLGYEINKDNIDNILKDIDWQVVMVYGLNLCFLYPNHPSNYALILFLLYEHNIDLPSEVNKIIKQYQNDSTRANEESMKVVLEVVNNKFIPSFLNHENKAIKMLIFKSLLDITSLLICYLVSYSIGDKNIEEELKKKIKPI